MSYYRPFLQQHNELIIHVNNYNEETLQGYASFGPNQKTINFENITSVFIVFDYYIDTLNFPESSTKKRLFNRRKVKTKEVFSMKKQVNVSSPDNEAVLKDDKAVFIVQVDYRQNATWQGSVTWVEGNEKKQFRSALELLMLMTSALSDAESESFSKVMQKTQSIQEAHSIDVTHLSDGQELAEFEGERQA